jgi:riboflavin kinase/FMN adenylyltransferase
MRILDNFRAVPADCKGAVLAIGNFDGVHRGHQALLLAAREDARTIRAPVGVMVFEPHPRQLFRPDQPFFRLTTLEQKLTLIERLGLDVAVVLRFDRALAELTAQRFIEEVLVAGLGVRQVVIGYDFHFGKDRGGSPAVMQAAGRVLGFAVTVLAPVAEGGEAFSSSAIRARLAAGDVRAAAIALGHWWRLAGTVVGGAKRGAGLGFPTANVVLPRGTALAHGIYAVRVYVEGARHLGAAYLGTRPTFDDGITTLEVFLLDFDGSLYGRQIEVEFIAFLRGDRRFGDAAELRAQMARDCEAARAALARVDADDPLRGLPLGTA